MRHDRFYFDDGNTIFLVRFSPSDAPRVDLGVATMYDPLIPPTKVEDTLFNVHRSILTHNSPIFEDMFSIPSGEGEADDKPILLESTSSLGFASLLSCLYPRYVQRQHPRVSAGENDPLLILRFTYQHCRKD